MYLRSRSSGPEGEDRALYYNSNFGVGGDWGCRRVVLWVLGLQGLWHTPTAAAVRTRRTRQSSLGHE